MFRCRQKLNYGRCFSASFQETEFDENGNSRTVFRDSRKPMPDPENFRLSNILKAGVPLQEVDTKIFNRLPTAQEFQNLSRSLEKKKSVSNDSKNTQTTATKE